MIQAFGFGGGSGPSPTLKTLFRPGGDYSDTDVVAIRNAGFRAANYSLTATGVNELSGRNLGKDSGWNVPTAEDLQYAADIKKQRPDLFPDKKWGLLSRFDSKVVVPVVQAVVVTGITAGVASGFGVGPLANPSPASSSGFTAEEIAAGSDAGTLYAPSAVTPTVNTGMTVTQATMLGSSGLGAAGSLVKPVLALTTAAAGLAGSVAVLKGSKDKAGLPDYAELLNTPTLANDIVKPTAFSAMSAGSSNVVLLAVGALVIVFLVKRFRK